MEGNTAKIYRLMLVLIVLAVVVYSFLPLTSPAKFTSPDESTSYFFIRLFAEKNSVSYDEPVNEMAFDIVKPRNASSFEGKVTSHNFFGIFLIYGAIAKAGIWVIEYITPILAALGILLFFILVKENFDEKTAIASSLLLAIFPPYWYWASMTTFNNIASTVLFIAAAIFFLRVLRGGKPEDYAIFGIYSGLTAIVRYEFLIVFALLFATILFRQFRANGIRYRQAAISLGLFIAIFSIVLFLNWHLYGSPLAIGGSPIEAPEEDDTQQIAGKILKRIAYYMAPSGINPLRMAENFFNYVFLITPMFTIACALGLLMWHFRPSPKTGNRGIAENHSANYALLLAIVFLFFLAYYGSGVFFGYTADEPITMSSYTRYLLPGTMLAMPFAAIFMGRFFTGKWLQAAFLAAIVISSVHTVYFSDFGLDSIREKRQNYAGVSEFFESTTESDAIIFARYWDKVIFPGRKVATNPRGGIDENVLAIAMVRMHAEGIPVYFVHDKKDVKVETINSYLMEEGLRLEAISRNFGGVYRLDAS